MSVELVAQIKADLVARGEDLSGPCGAFKITKRVAWALRREGYFLLKKPSGNNCEGYSVDYIVHESGQGYDILSDAGGANTPGFTPGDTFTADRLGAPIDPVDPVGTIPTPTPLPVPPEGNPFAEINEKLDEIYAAMLALSANPFPDYEGRIFGYPVVLKPRK